MSPETETGASSDPRGAIEEAPTFSIVIPAFNAERTVEATLRSLFAQTDPDFEAVVVDDGSTDETLRRVEAVRDARVRVVRQSNAGLSAARNAGIAATTGRYVAILDSDDLWLPAYLGEMRQALDAHPEAALAYTDAWAWYEKVARFGRRTMMASVDPPDIPPEDPRQLFLELVARNFVYGSTTIRRCVLAEVGGFDEDLRRSEDWELWLRIAARGYRFARVPPVLALYRVRAGSLSSDVGLMREAERAALEKVSRYDLDVGLEHVVRERLETLARRPPPPPALSAGGVVGRERLTRHLPSSIRVRSYRLRRPRAVPAELEHALRSSQGSS